MHLLLPAAWLNSKSMRLEGPDHFDRLAAGGGCKKTF
jgi:hypothetical protein